MKKRIVLSLLAMVTGITFMAGWAERPESSLVKEKEDIKEVPYEETKSEEQGYREYLSGKNIWEMSGSPILQNGKIVGAVTHVLVNDPTRGYGIFIENMLEAAE